jgi:hypothetical protein
MVNGWFSMKNMDQRKIKISSFYGGTERGTESSLIILHPTVSLDGRLMEIESPSPPGEREGGKSGPLTRMGVGSSSLRITRDQNGISIRFGRRMDHG